jgi:peptidoglycan/LPS O-acetylase OafA/YrhL
MPLLVPSHLSLLAVGAVLLAAAFVATVISALVPYYARLVRGASRLAALDGLRGLLALGVCVHHSAIVYNLVRLNVWNHPANVLFEYLGPGCVSLFFMASGFLFWSKLLDGKLDVEAFFSSRLRRVMPMYLASATGVLLVVGWLSKWHVNVPAPQLRKEVTLWLLGGFFDVPGINGISTVPINAGVTWSLVYEWWFYFSLPILSLFVPVRRFLVGLLVFLLLWWAAPSHVPEYVPGFDRSLGFAMGMGTAYFCRLRGRRWLQRRGAAALALLWIAGCLVLRVYSHLPAIPFEMVGFPLFAVVASGNNCFKLLTRRWVLLLGHVSYSVYLSHGLALYLLVQRGLGYTRVVGMGVIEYWAYIAGVVIPCVVACAALTYRWIEAPLMRSRPLERRRPGGIAPRSHEARLVGETRST